MSYKDKAGRPFVEGDYVYYTERPYSDYADSLNIVHNDNGELKLRWLVTNYGGIYISEIDNEGTDFMVSFNFHTHPSEHPDVCEDSLILDNVSGDLVEYMNKNFPLINNNHSTKE